MVTILTESNKQMESIMAKNQKLEDYIKDMQF